METNANMTVTSQEVPTMVVVGRPGGGMLFRAKNEDDKNS